MAEAKEKIEERPTKTKETKTGAEITAEEKLAISEAKNKELEAQLEASQANEKDAYKKVKGTFVHEDGRKFKFKDSFVKVRVPRGRGEIVSSQELINEAKNKKSEGHSKAVAILEQLVELEYQGLEEVK